MILLFLIGNTGVDRFTETSQSPRNDDVCLRDVSSSASPGWHHVLWSLTTLYIVLSLLIWLFVFGVSVVKGGSSKCRFAHAPHIYYLHYFYFYFSILCTRACFYLHTAHLCTQPQCTRTFSLAHTAHHLSCRG